VGIQDAQDLNRAARSSQIRVVSQAFVRRVHGLACRVVQRVEAVARGVTRPVRVIGGLIRDVVRSREEPVAENTLLRQQLIVAARTVRKPRFTSFERGLLVILARDLIRRLAAENLLWGAERIAANS
jgi:hypothetical protein